MDWLWWFVGTMVFGIIEMFTLEFTFAMLAVGTLAGGVAALLGAPWWLAVIVFAAASAMLLVFVRPHLLKYLWKKSPLVEMNSNAMVGRVAQTIDPITATAGRVKLNGEVWSARTVDGAPAVSEGSEVTVVAINGATAIVAAENGVKDD